MTEYPSRYRLTVLIDPDRIPPQAGTSSPCGVGFRLAGVSSSGRSMVSSNSIMLSISGAHRDIGDAFGMNNHDRHAVLRHQFAPSRKPPASPRIGDADRLAAETLGDRA
jgi:hypothetical protein